ncbi:hypothetical protein CRN40_00895 [Vibrio vulnificus]|nr:hypothetical protein CRN40_00895 [Vibrio vulnificus]
MFWILGLFVSLFILYSDYAYYFYSRRRGVRLTKSKLISLALSVTLPMIATTEILNDFEVNGVTYQVVVVCVTALVGALVCLSERYRFKLEK